LPQKVDQPTSLGLGKRRVMSGRLDENGPQRY
jgi:hypothetical protein